jgi:soluble lytic murein transglycosylase
LVARVYGDENTDPQRLPATLHSRQLGVGKSWRVEILPLVKAHRLGLTFALLAGSALFGGAAAAQTAPATNAAAAAAPLGYTPSADLAVLSQALQAAKNGDINGATSLQNGLSDPVARKLVTWAMIDSAGTMLSFSTLDSARRDLLDWPRASRRRSAAEKTMEYAGLPPQRVVDFFQGQAPETAEGAMTLAAAYQSLGKPAEAQALIRKTWTEMVFEADAQSRMLARFGGLLTPEDHVKRLDMLLYGPQGPATRAMMDLVDADHRAVAEARIALRANRSDAPSLVDQTPAALKNDPGLSFERARYLRKRGLPDAAAALIPNFPTPPPQSDAAAQIWTERRILMTAALKNRDIAGAYAAVVEHNLPTGADYAEAEFFAGWIALSKQNKPALADEHFARIQKAGTSPITVSRALYWRGRANEAKGDLAAAQKFYAEGAKYYTAFYGQLAAGKAGVKEIVLPPDPTPTTADRARFEGRDMVRAAKLLGDSGQRDLFRVFVLAIDDVLPNPEELALLVDLAKRYGDQDLAMRVVRAGAQRGLFLTERGYPIRATPVGFGMPEPALTFGITRQESGFDPMVRSPVGARGMMQLMPATASHVARKIGVGYSPARLDDPDYNMRLGASYLGQLVDGFSGSYVMAVAGYNAGPGRPAQWISDCGDPRTASTDAADFIECIPFSETRNYVMRVLEGMTIYRARLNGGSAPLELAADLKRGTWTPGGYKPLSSQATPGYTLIGPSAADDEVTPASATKVSATSGKSSKATAKKGKSKASAKKGKSSKGKRTASASKSKAKAKATRRARR